MVKVTAEPESYDFDRCEGCQDVDVRRIADQRGVDVLPFFPPNQSTGK